MTVQFIGSEENGWLRTGQKYFVQAIHFEKLRGVLYRIISEDSEIPAIFPAFDFIIVDGSLSTSWEAFSIKMGILNLEPISVGA